MRCHYTEGTLRYNARGAVFVTSEVASLIPYRGTMKRLQRVGSINGCGRAIRVSYSVQERLPMITKYNIPLLLQEKTITLKMIKIAIKVYVIILI